MRRLRPEAAAQPTVEGRGYDLAGHPVVLGRSKDCDIRLSDPNVSRRHAEVRPDGIG